MAEANRITIARVAHGRGPIDVEFLGRQTLGDAGLEQEVLRLFDVMSHTYMSRLEDSTSREALLQHLHTMKGAAGGVGAFGLADLARDMEAKLAAGGVVDPEQIEDIRLAVEEVSAFISQRISSAA